MEDTTMAADDAWDREDMEKAAYHEAGHAVVAWSFDLVVRSVHLDVANNSGHAKIADADRLEDVTHRVAVSYAGFEAEDMFKRPAVFVRAQDDFDRASEALKNALANQFGKGLSSPEGRRLQAACRARAQDRIIEHEAKVRRVAKELLQPPYEIGRAKFEQMMQED
jgi:hypothetical protein